MRCQVYLRYLEDFIDLPDADCEGGQYATVYFSVQKFTILVLTSKSIGYLFYHKPYFMVSWVY